MATRRLDSAIIFCVVDFVWEVIKRFLAKYRLRGNQNTTNCCKKKFKTDQNKSSTIWTRRSKNANTFQYFFAKMMHHANISKFEYISKIQVKDICLTSSKSEFPPIRAWTLWHKKKYQMSWPIVRKRIQMLDEDFHF